MPEHLQRTFSLAILPIALIFLLTGCALFSTPEKALMSSLETEFDLPPEPKGSASRTLSGVDRNENGVRDDVERALFLWAHKMGYPEIYPDIPELLLDVSRDIEAFLVTDSPREASSQVIRSADVFKEYVHTTNVIERQIAPSLRISDSDAIWALNYTKGLILNTPERKEVYRDQGHSFLLEE